MTLKEARKKYQGKYFKQNGCYYRFVKITKESDSFYYLIYVECVDTLLGYIDNNATLHLHFDDEALFNNQFKKITKDEFKKNFNKINQQILKQTIGSAIPEIKIDGYKIDNVIYYKPADFYDCGYFTLDGEPSSITYWSDYIK